MFSTRGATQASRFMVSCHSDRSFVYWIGFAVAACFARIRPRTASSVNLGCFFCHPALWCDVVSSIPRRTEEIAGNTKNQALGEVAERPIVQHWKCCVRETGPRVRIPPSPLIFEACETFPVLQAFFVAGSGTSGDQDEWRLRLRARGNSRILRILQESVEIQPFRDSIKALATVETGRSVRCFRTGVRWLWHFRFGNAPDLSTATSVDVNLKSLSGRSQQDVVATDEAIRS